MSLEQATSLNDRSDAAGAASESRRIPSPWDLRCAAIRHTAYLIAQRRAFAPGHELEDWLTAERQFDTDEAPELSNPRELRHAAICRAAYLIAQRRGFTPGRELEDWLIAEKEFDVDACGKREPRSATVHDIACRPKRPIAQERRPRAASPGERLEPRTR